MKREEDKKPPLHLLRFQSSEVQRPVVARSVCGQVSNQSVEGAGTAGPACRCPRCEYSPREWEPTLHCGRKHQPPLITGTLSRAARWAMPLEHLGLRVLALAPLLPLNHRPRRSLSGGGCDF